MWEFLLACSFLGAEPPRRGPPRSWRRVMTRLLSLDVFYIRRQQALLIFYDGAGGCSGGRGKICQMCHMQAMGPFKLPVANCFTRGTCEVVNSSGVPSQATRPSWMNSSLSTARSMVECWWVTTT